MARITGAGLSLRTTVQAVPATYRSLEHVNMVRTHWTACGRYSSRELVRLRCQNVMVAAPLQASSCAGKSNKSREGQVTR
eukprot:scaffold50187_cov61-Phaeocystis_antarctica.AAC.4